jgi:hypothetical protein
MNTRTSGTGTPPDDDPGRRSLLTLKAIGELLDLWQELTTADKDQILATLRDGSGVHVCCDREVMFVPAGDGLYAGYARKTTSAAGSLPEAKAEGPGDQQSPGPSASLRQAGLTRRRGRPPGRLAECP